MWLGRSWSITGSKALKMSACMVKGYICQRRGRTTSNLSWRVVHGGQRIKIKYGVRGKDTGCCQGHLGHGSLLHEHMVGDMNGCRIGHGHGMKRGSCSGCGGSIGPRAVETRACGTQLRQGVRGKAKAGQGVAIALGQNKLTVASTKRCHGGRSTTARGTCREHHLLRLCFLAFHLFKIKMLGSMLEVLGSGRMSLMHEQSKTPCPTPTILYTQGLPHANASGEQLKIQGALSPFCY